MAIDADILRAMAAAGASIEVIIAAVEADALKENARRESKRENNAERQRRFKAKRRGRTSSNAGNALPRVTPPIEEIIPPVSSDEETTAPPKAKRGKLAVKPADVEDQTWEDFQALRKRKGSPLTVTALNGIEAEARKAGWSLEAAIAKCITRGWQGFEAEWVQQSTGPPGRADPGSFLSHYIEKDRVRQQVNPA
jgi:hypothetical protein